MQRQVIILSTRSGDWEGLYIDNLLLLEGECITDMKTLVMMQEKYEITPIEIVLKELGNTDSANVEEYGCMGMSEQNYRACAEAFQRLV